MNVMRHPLTERLRLSTLLGAGCAALLTFGLVPPASADVPTPTTPAATVSPAAPGSGPTLGQMNSAHDHTMGSTLSLDPSLPHGTSPSGSATPHAMATRSSASGTPGVDVSAWQTFNAGNWLTMYNNGLRFAYVKATESTDYSSSQFSEQYNDSAAAGLFHGAYHFATPNASSGAAQAQFFVAHGGNWVNDGKTLPPLLDIEYDPYTSTDGTNECYGLSQDQMVGWIQSFSDTVQQLTGRYPAIYSTTGWWSTCTGNTPSFGNSPLFIASWPSDSSSGPGTLPNGWPSYTFWQWTDNTTQPSPTGTQTVDGDVLSTSQSLPAVATTFSGTVSFIDVPSSYPFATEITWLASAGISVGWATPQGRLFEPQTPIARDAMAAFLYRFAGSPAFTPPSRSPFADVPITYPFYKQITWLAATGITTGYPDGTFQPGSSVNRDAMAAFLYRFAGSPAFTPPSTSSSFTDVPTTYPFYKQITWLASTGITTGYPDGAFQPGSAVNRDAMAAFLYRYHNDNLPTHRVTH